VRAELEALVAAGCTEITVDEPSMSCYAYKEDTKRFVEIFNRTVAPVVSKCRLSTHLCFGNFKGPRRRPAPVRAHVPPFSWTSNVDEIHLEMASREFAELELLGEIAKAKDVSGWHCRCEKLLYRDAGRDCQSACACV
jgi:5-methyltetrahydropteroyltriglutamate--homocysteine methyltransferase